MPLSLTQTVAPTQEPVSIDDLKLYLRIEHADEDFLLGMLLRASRLDCERFIRKQFLTATWQLKLDDWPTSNIIRVPKPPLQSVSSISYIDADGNPQTLNSSVYQVDIISHPGRIMPAFGQVWPTLRGETLNAITITFLAGWTTPTLVPDSLRIAIMMLAGDMYEHRENQLEAKVEQNQTVMKLLWHERLLEVA